MHTRQQTGARLKAKGFEDVIDAEDAFPLSAGAALEAAAGLACVSGCMMLLRLRHSSTTTLSGSTAWTHQAAVCAMHACVLVKCAVLRLPLPGIYVQGAAMMMQT